MRARTIASENSFRSFSRRQSTLRGGLKLSAENGEGAQDRRRTNGSSCAASERSARTSASLCRRVGP